MDFVNLMTITHVIIKRFGLYIVVYRDNVLFDSCLVLVAYASYEWLSYV